MGVILICCSFRLVRFYLLFIIYYQMDELEENKINRDKVREEADYYYIKMFDDDEILLMLLSISDSPINDLINILK